MPDYHLFGRILRSELLIPELTAVQSAAAEWKLTIENRSTSATSGEEVGREEVDDGVFVTLFADDGALRMVFDDTGAFEVSSTGLDIRWFPALRADLDAVRKDVLGRVLAVALHQQGIVTLHGSAVALGENAIAFAAPKFHGKSTTAAALTATGARLLADDVVAITPGARPCVTPSVPLVQLWGDSAERLGVALRDGDESAASQKLQLRFEQATGAAPGPTPLAAVYLLAPMNATTGRGVRRVRLSGVTSALALLGQSKIGGLLGTARRSILLQRMSVLADQVPVYRLEVPRDFDRLAETTDALWSWHSESPASAHSQTG
jgi:hypothetical protein